MPRRESYSDTFTGEADENLRAIIESGDDGEKSRFLKKLLINVINNELTPRQKEVFMLFYFKKMDMVSIGKKLGITPQSVSSVMIRARLRMVRILKYYL
ncbi:MAG: sigma-70 family RNA polymerase sigma factor [Ruminococcus sp.]|nr:sigma-70 family RNA polymerase sigma factor [Ruminococcus sp.]